MKDRTTWVTKVVALIASGPILMAAALVVSAAFAYAGSGNLSTNAEKVSGLRLVGTAL